ncbi:MAG: PorT family protein [Bacteroidaceae bacterium]|nr:PorT family protein [Bacteroidaceae bacterium]
MKKILISIIAAIISIPSIAKDNEVSDSDNNLFKAAIKGWHVRLSAGYNIGGTAPLPLPVEIRSIESYNPGLNFSIEGTVEKMFGKGNWGLRWGLRLETKGMTTEAGTKNYHTEVMNDGNIIEGPWTGNVKIYVSNTYLTLPVLAIYKFNERWNMSGGLFVSYMFDGKFSGEVHNGYIREKNPTGTKLPIESASYDFSEYLSKFNWGLQIGGEYTVYKHLAIFADLKWSFNSIFPDSFKSITFPLYPIYGTLGFAYLF